MGSSIPLLFPLASTCFSKSVAIGDQYNLEFSNVVANITYFYHT